MTALDFKKTRKHLYQPSAKEFSLVEVPEMQFIMIDGHGDPNGSLDYQQTVESLYAVAYPIKFTLKAQGLEYVVPPLEGLWWVEDMKNFSMERKDLWDWTMMIMQPDEVTPEVFEKACQDAIRKKGLAPLSRMRLERFEEGLAGQILYKGAYADEGPTIQRLHEFIHAQGLVLCGKHHEIYLGDPRRNLPEKLKTVIRQPGCRVD